MSFTYDRDWYRDTFLEIFSGWYRILEKTSDSFAVWQPDGGIVLNNFVSRSGLQCDGVARMLPALAAWAAQPANPDRLSLDDGREIDPREIIFKALVNGADPAHRDFWGDTPAKGQRQVEASIIAWSLWLSRDWLPPELSETQVRNIQHWLAGQTVFTDHFNNWSLFTAVNHAVRHALREHGFDGSIEEIRRDLLPGDELYLRDGWCLDCKYSNIDYYNFWVFGSHHCYLKAILPDYQNVMLDRALRKFTRRLRDLPMLIDAAGQNVLFGRSLPYRWGWLTGLITAHYVGIEALDPGLSRAMLGRNLRWWLDAGSINSKGALRENLTPAGSRGGSSSYINCGHPYWGMQAFLCMALPPEHQFWTASARPLPAREDDFRVARQGPGFVFQGLRESGEVRLFSLRNRYHHASALYDKFVYSSAFPCNSATTDYHTAWDNQFALRLPDGRSISPSDIQEVDTNDGENLRTSRCFHVGGGKELQATVLTTLRIVGAEYVTSHEIDAQVCRIAGAQWIEGGFPLGFNADGRLETGGEDGALWARVESVGRKILCENLGGWDHIQPAEKWKELWPGYEPEANIIWPRSVHFLLTASVKEGASRLSSRHGAWVRGDALAYRATPATK